MIVRESVMVGRQAMTLETGRLAKQAGGSVFLTYGGTQVLVTVCSADPRRGGGFFPLTCEYIEKTYAGGRIPGGFFKREARLRDEEVLTCRIMDRPCRPLFPDGFMDEVQIIATVLSSDGENRADMLALTGASAALHISDLPWDGPIAGVRVGRVDGELIANPTLQEIEASDMDIVVAASHDAIVMVEGGAKEISERDLADALEFGHAAAQPVIDLIEELRAVAGKPKREFVAPKLPDDVLRRVSEVCDDGIRRASRIPDKHERYHEYSAVRAVLAEKLTAEMGADAYAAGYLLINEEFEARKSHIVRSMVLDEKVRIDGRDMRTVRPITIIPGALARTHGSALFQRGETQGMATVTLGTSSDEQKIDGLNGERWKRFFLHYNFPPFSTGEVKRVGSPGRREVGHGALAERALTHVMPPKAEFPYTVRVVSETLESNGSSSMAATCGGCLALMDAGVPIKAPVAGIAMGLIHDGQRYAILSDILGDEDHLGDMDFKVTGTSKGITAIQMDIKVKGLDRSLMLEALEQAREGRAHILGKMLEALPGPRPELSPFAPRIVTIKVKPDQVRMIIGPGGKTIRGIVDQTGARIDVEDDGTVNVASSDGESLRRAIELVEALTAEPEIGKVYDGVVRRVTDFGAFVEILPNWDGLVHISELAWGRTERVEDVCREGDPLTVKVLSIEDGKVRLSHRETTAAPEGWVPAERPPRRGNDRFGSPRGDRDRPPRDRDRPPRGRGDRDRPPRDRDDRDRRPRDRDDADRPPRDRDDRERRPRARDDGEPSFDREARPRRPRDRDDADRPPRDREERDRRPRARDDGERPPRDQEERDDRPRRTRERSDAARRPARESKPREPADDAGRWGESGSVDDEDVVRVPDSFGQRPETGESATDRPRRARARSARTVTTGGSDDTYREAPSSPGDERADAPPADRWDGADGASSTAERGWGLGDRPRLRSTTGARSRDRDGAGERRGDDGRRRSRDRDGGVDRGADDAARPRRDRDGDRGRDRSEGRARARSREDEPEPRDDDRRRARGRDDAPRDRDAEPREADRPRRTRSTEGRSRDPRSEEGTRSPGREGRSRERSSEGRRRERSSDRPARDPGRRSSPGRSGGSDDYDE